MKSSTGIPPILKVDDMDDQYRKNGAFGKGASEELQLKWGMYYQKAGTA